MARRLTLHIGSHKTGTTTVQSTFLRNEASLKQKGLTFVHGRKSTVHEFLGALNPPQFLPGGFKLRDVDEFKDLLQAAEGDDLFASSENFSFFFHPEPIADLAEAIRPMFDDVRILVYLRRQDRQMVSHHQEAAKPHRAPAGHLWGHELTPLPRPQPQHALYLDYARRIGHWADAFGDSAMAIRVFDRRTLVDGDIVADVLSVLGLDGEGIGRVEDRNLSLSALQARLGHMMNTAGVGEALSTAIIDAAGDGPRAQPSRSEAEAFYAPWRESNARLNARFGISALPSIFDEDFDDYPDQATPVWDLAQAERALDVVLGVLGREANPMPVFDPEDLLAATHALRQSNPKAALKFARAARMLRPKAEGLRSLIEGLQQRIGGGGKRRTQAKPAGPEQKKRGPKAKGRPGALSAQDARTGVRRPAAKPARRT
jgi:hypothetical protein